MEIKEIVRRPIFFERNRVYRVYTGGKPYPDFFGTEEEGDNNFPEEWVASSVKAINSVYFGKRDGVSVVKGTDIFFDDLLNEHKDELLGNRKFDILVKFLDSAIRLPMQVHPTKEFSLKNFNSPFGKTESWLVIATRPGAKMYFGFNDKYNIDTMLDLEEKSELDKDAMETIALSREVKVGDCFIIKAGLVHAIGAGCTVIEVQEPTDFTIQPERWCGDLHLSEREEFLSLDKKTAMSCFNFDLYGDKAIKSALVEPEVVINSNGLKKETLITYDHTECFATNRYTLDNSSFNLNYGPSLYICLEGEGEVAGEEYSHHIKRGDYFFMPYSAQGKFDCKTDKHLVIIECLPSKQDL